MILLVYYFFLHFSCIISQFHTHSISSAYPAPVLESSLCDHHNLTHIYYLMAFFSVHTSGSSIHISFYLSFLAFYSSILIVSYFLFLFYISLLLLSYSLPV